jgi:hypothetical protein
MGQQTANGNGGFDWGLRDRVTESVEHFLRTLDAALADPVPEGLEALRHDSDRVMRAVARVRLEIERISDERD